MVTQTAEKPRMGYSNTTFNNYTGCPGSLALKKGLAPVSDVKVPERPSLWRDGGRLGHEIAAKYMQHLVSTMQAQDIPEMERLARQMPLQQTAVPKKIFPDIFKACMTLATEIELDWMNVKGVERFFSVKVGRYVFRGVIDLLIAKDTHCHIRDWKFGRVTESQSDVENNAQLRGYLIGAKQVVPHMKTATIELFYAPYGVSRVVHFLSDELADVLAETEADIITQADAIEADTKFPFTRGDYCDWCDYPDLCPLIARDVEAGRLVILNDEDAREVAENVLAGDAIRKLRIDALRGWATPNGDITVGKKVFGFKGASKLQRPTTEVIELLKADRISHDKIVAAMKFDNKALDSLVLAEGSAELVQGIAAVTVDKGGSVFKVRNVKKEEDDNGY